MKKFQYILFFLIPIMSIAQNKTIESDSLVYNSAGVEKEPQFPGGINEFYKYIGENYNLPNDKDFKGGKIFTSFVIEKDGRITDVKVLRDIGFGTSEEVIRVLNASPLWLPAEQNGLKVRVQYSLPIVLQQPLIEEIDYSKIYAAEDTDALPDFQGGVVKFYDFIRKNYHAPEKSGLSGKVLIGFVVEVDGTLTDIKVIVDAVGYGCGDEAVRVLNLSPKWIPGQIDGKAVRCSFIIPIQISTEEVFIGRSNSNQTNYFPNESRPTMYVPR